MQTVKPQTTSVQSRAQAHIRNWYERKYWEKAMVKFEILATVIGEPAALAQLEVTTSFKSFTGRCNERMRSRPTTIPLAEPAQGNEPVHNSIITEIAGSTRKSPNALLAMITKGNIKSLIRLFRQTFPGITNEEIAQKLIELKEHYYRANNQSGTECWFFRLTKSACNTGSVKKYNPLEKIDELAAQLRAQG